MLTSVTVKGEPRKSHTVLSNWTSGRPPDSVMDFRLTFEEGQARLFEKVTSYSWQSQCRSRYQRRSKHLEKVTRCSHAWPLQDLSLRLISLVRFAAIPRLTLKKVKSDCFRRSLPIRTSENINAKGNISPFWALRMSGLNLVKATRCFHAGLLEDRPIPSWIFRLTFEEGQAWLFVKLTSYPDKVNADQHIREGQGISKKPHGALMLDLCRIFHYAWFRWHDSAWFRPFQKVTSHGFHHDLRPGGRLPRKSITECFRAGPAWKIQKQQPQVSSWHGTWRCLVLVQAPALGNHSETVFLRQVCFLKIRPNLTRKTDFVHDLWAFSCTQSLWIGTRTLRLVHSSSLEWWCPRFSMSDGIRHNYQQMKPLSDKVLEGL